MEHIENEKLSKSAIFKHLRADVKSAKKAKTEVDEMMAESNRIYDGTQDKDNDKDLVLKEVAKFIENQKPSVIEPFVDQVKPIRVSGKDGLKSRVAEQYLNKMFTQKFNRQKFTEDVLDVMSREGTVWVRSGWDFREITETENFKNVELEDALEAEKIEDLVENKDGTYNYKVTKTKIINNNPIATVWRNEHVYPDPEAKSDDEIRFLAVRRTQTISELRESKLYKEKDLQKIERKVYNDDEGSALQTDREAKGKGYGQDEYFNVLDKSRQKIDIIEYWGYYDVNNDGIAEPIIATWVEGHNVNLRLEENKFNIGTIPFHRQVYSSVTFSLWGNPLAFFIGDLQTIKAGTIQGILDNMSLANNGQKFIKRGTLDYVNFKRMQNGDSTVIVNGDPKGIADGSYNNIPQSVFQVVALVDKEGSDMAGVNQGSQIGNKQIDSADFDSGQSSTSQNRTEDLVRKISQLYKQIFSDWLKMASMYLENEQIESYLKEEEMEFLDVFEDGDFDVTVTVGSRTSTDARLRELNLLMQQTGDDYEIKTILEAEMFELMNKPDLAEKIRNRQPPQPSEMELMMQQIEMQKAQLELSKLQVEIQKIQSDGQAIMIKAQASMEGATNGRISATSKARVDGAKSQDIEVDSWKKTVETGQEQQTQGQ